MAIPSFSSKDPDEVLDYVVNWAARLATDDTIATSTWTVPAGITKDSSSNTDTTTKVWLSGGTLGTTYTLLNRVTTVDGRTMDQSVKIKIAAK